MAFASATCSGTRSPAGLSTRAAPPAGTRFPAGRRARHVQPRASTVRSPVAASGVWFPDVKMAPADPILGVSQAFKASTDPRKMNLGVGAYRDDEGKPHVLPSVREAERRVSGQYDMEYLPIEGHAGFISRSVELAYGAGSEPLTSGRVAAVQTLSGTGACRLFAEFARRHLPGAAAYVPLPTWSNHHNILDDAGVERRAYRYYDAATGAVGEAALLEDLREAPRGSIILLHACAHNPTGADLSPDQWRRVSALMRERGLFPFFDMAYQGFASGDFARDAVALGIFLEDGHTFALSQSYAKNMGLYGQRVGCLSVICADGDEAGRVKSQLKAIARAAYSSPPLHGALLADAILSDDALRSQWLGEVAGMAGRIQRMRTLLREGLEATGSRIPWDRVTDQIGMFCFSGLTPEQVDRLTAEHAIFMTRNGRISVAGVTPDNVGRLAEAIHEVTK